MRRKRKDFTVTTKKSPFELELDNTNGDGPKYVTFADPNKIGTKDALQMSRDSDPEKVLRTLLGEDFDAFWGEWSAAPIDETNKLIEEVMEHYQGSTSTS